jgi:aquaporin Z
VLLVRATVGMAAGHPAVQFAATMPGTAGVAAAFAAELVISFVLMTVVLIATNDLRLAPYTPFICGALVATYIAVEAPLSGMSMNPARSFASALVAGRWTGLWIYFTAPPLGMLAAAEAYVRWPGSRRVLCAKLDHGGAGRCIFRCDVAATPAGAPRIELAEPRSSRRRRHERTDA